MRQRTEHREPVRSCIGCRTRRPRSALVRITRARDDIVVDGPSDGRGAWLCAELEPGATMPGDEQRRVAAECLDTAIAKRAFARAWRTAVSADDITNIRRHTGHL